MWVRRKSRNNLPSIRPDVHYARTGIFPLLYDQLKKVYSIWVCFNPPEKNWKCNFKIYYAEGKQKLGITYFFIRNSLVHWYMAGEYILPFIAFSLDNFIMAGVY